MATFVLVHGAMHGGWCWRDVARRLRAEGHAVHAPTLTGQGERRHLLTPQVGLGTHLEDLVALFGFEGLHDVHLVLHSYAGALAGPLAGAARPRLASITYLAAFVVEPGECVLDVEPAGTVAHYRDLVARDGDGWRVPASDAFLDQWGITDPAARGWVGPRLTDLPFRCLTDPAVYDSSALTDLPHGYVRHTDPPLPSLDRSFGRAVKKGWPTVDLATGHDLMVTAPGATTEVILRLALGAAEP